nr:hypothetical protein [Tanacetum cinerariifolium]
MGIEYGASWVKEQVHMGRSGEGFGTIQVEVVWKRWGNSGKRAGKFVESVRQWIKVNVLDSNFNLGSMICKIFMLHVPPESYDFEGKIIPCKQHRASCKTKPVSFVDQPLFRLHMDLFGPTFVKILNKKSYCLVVIDDYSRSDNGTEFKNSDLNKFCGMKGIKREFSVPRTPQQNGITERKNMTLIEAARTMLADSLLPILFWVEAVNTACYVQNRVLVTKPHNKTPYEFLHGRTNSIGFMRPFGYLVTILNTLDSLGKFKRKVDEGFLVGYSVSSKAFRVFNSRTRIVQETLHVNFLENKPNVASSGPTWLFDIDSPTRTMNYQPVIAGNQTNPSVCFQDKFDAAFDGKEHDFDARKPESEVILSPSSSAQSRKQDDKTKKEAKGKSLVESFIGFRDLSVEFEDCFDNSSNEVNAAGIIEWEDITYSDDENDVDPEADFNNLETSITVCPILTTKIHKDHPVLQIIGDSSSTTQTRRGTQEVDLPYGKRAIGTKWAYRNKKDERGIAVRNKARHVAHGHTHEEGIDYEEVFTPVARIEAIRLFLAYASFMGFMVYQMDVKSVFVYGTIEDEVYVCQPSRFKDPDHPYKVVKVKQKKDGIFISQDKYVVEILRKFGSTKEESASTSIDTEKPLLKDPGGEDVDVHTYRSMIGSLMYLTSSRPDIMFACKKQTVVATSSTEAEYVAASSCCAHVL